MLCVAALGNTFVTAFWTFINLAGYERSEAGTAPRRYYRFRRQSDPAYPAMLELFSRRIDGVAVPDDVHLTPVPTGEDLSSLSAILLDDDLYAWVQEGRQTISHVAVVGAVHLIALKVRALRDLSDRRSRGEAVDSKDIKKHRSDVLRLLQVVRADPLDTVPHVVRSDTARFAAMIREESPAVHNLRLVFGSPEEALGLLEVLFGTRPKS